ncbi:NAD(P)-dependent oxidoreductase [Pajaroellobacter abortibovis]|uniref:2-oxoglutarate reductase n=1 Tax=Pajaroellobacter abortibovis TaxID=1882918 RepID=A0A1L6MVE1_9BACT|nr:NAD(P)-dependent oxidoreductase [Pajaroellobacter abortibovis]APR99500.1 hypothetical protein BCY86_01485 [Pajaroellobacter abortibovis]
MNLLIADQFHSSALEELYTLPLTTHYEPNLTEEELEEKIAEVSILVVRSTPVTAKMIAAAKSLHLIVRAGTEYNTIDVQAASKRGIYVAHVPGKNATAVAELVFGLLLSLDRRIPDAVNSLRNGSWERSPFKKAEGLYGKSIGIAGLGATGKEVAYRAKAFGLRVIAFSRRLTHARAHELGVQAVGSIEELAKQSDILTIHLPLTEKTKGLISQKIFDLLPERAIFINVARAGIVDYHAMRKAIQSHHLRAAIDVYPNEPQEGNNPYASWFVAPVSDQGFLYGTPHIASATDQAQSAIASEVVHIIRSFVLEGYVPHVVNMLHTSSARFQLIIRMKDRAGVLGNTLTVLKKHGIHVEEVINKGFEGGEATCAKLRILSSPSEACLAEIRAIQQVIHLALIPLPNLA